MSREKRNKYVRFWLYLEVGGAWRPLSSLKRAVSVNKLTSVTCWSTGWTMEGPGQRQALKGFWSTFQPLSSFSLLLAATDKDFSLNEIPDTHILSGKMCPLMLPKRCSPNLHPLGQSYSTFPVPLTPCAHLAHMYFRANFCHQPAVQHCSLPQWTPALE